MTAFYRIEAKGLSVGQLRELVTHAKGLGAVVRIEGDLHMRLLGHSCPAQRGCIEWRGYRNAGGYGRLAHRRRVVLAHRAAFALWREPIPAGMDVCHRCDNPACINPDHLFLGTDLDNMRDREAKKRGRQPRGAANGQAKLNESDVRSIRQIGRTQREADLARRFGVAPTTIGKVRRGESWGHIA